MKDILYLPFVKAPEIVFLVLCESDARANQDAPFVIVSLLCIRCCFNKFPGCQ